MTYNVLMGTLNPTLLLTVYVCMYVSVLGPVVDPNAPKPEGSTITPTIGEQLIVSCTALSTANVMA